MHHNTQYTVGLFSCLCVCVCVSIVEKWVIPPPSPPQLFLIFFLSTFNLYILHCTRPNQRGRFALHACSPLDDSCLSQRERKRGMYVFGTITLAQSENWGPFRSKTSRHLRPFLNCSRSILILEVLPSKF